MKYFGGIEGGATNSKCVVCDEKGALCALVTGLSTNHWQLGIPEVTERIADMVNRAKREARIPEATHLVGLGLSLSGCLEETSNKELERSIRAAYPDLADNYVVCDDTMCGIFTASPTGGIVSIAGTGSNTLLRNPDGTTYSCGGFGHFISDEGSAFHITHRALKIVFDDMDGFSKAPHSIELVWQLIQEHFNVKTKLEMLPHLYANFDKSFFSSLCKKLAACAEDGDALCLSIFEYAGKCLGTNIKALLPRVHKDLVKSNDLNVVCVGSVWISWSLLKNGFVQMLNANKIPFGINLVRLTKEAALGACYMAADSKQFLLPRNYADNYTILYHYERNCEDEN